MKADLWYNKHCIYCIWIWRKNQRYF